MNTKKIIQKTVIGLLVLSLIAGCTVNHPFVNGQKSNPSAFWLTLAANAWNYFQPGVGIDAQTGLPQNGVGTSYFTDWDTGLYLQTVLDAEKLGIIASGGIWGADDRIDKVLSYLEKRSLMEDGLPYIAYSSRTYQNATDIEQVATDAGCLFIALNNIEEAKPSLKPRVDNIVYGITNYTRRQISVDALIDSYVNGKRPPCIYDYYTTCGFADFWPQRYSAEADALLDYIVSSPKVNYQGVLLPQAKITSEPLLMSIFYSSQPDVRVLELSKQAYLAQEARYNVTGQFTAFSEGSGEGVFIWEWIVLHDGRMWIIQTGDSNDLVHSELKIEPVVYLKAATGFLALYNSPYTRTMVDYLLKTTPDSSFGYYTGVTESNTAIIASRDTGNGLIISSARYAIDNKIDTLLTYPAPTSNVATQTTTIQSLKDNTQMTPNANLTPTATPNPPAPTRPSTLQSSEVYMQTPQEPTEYLWPIRDSAYLMATVLIVFLAVIVYVVYRKDNLQRL